MSLEEVTAMHAERSVRTRLRAELAAEQGLQKLAPDVCRGASKDFGHGHSALFASRLAAEEGTK